MGKPKIDAMEALSLINAGADNSTLMKKFNLSLKGLHSLFDKLIQEGLLEANAPGSAPVNEDPGAPTEPGRELSAREVLRDIRSGKSDADLMEKYALSAKGLDHLFMQLLGAGLISGKELEERVIEPDSTVDLKDSLLSSAILEGKEEYVKSQDQEDMVPVEVEYEPPETRFGVDVVDEYEKSTKVDDLQIKKDEKCPVCGQSLRRDDDEDDNSDVTESLTEEDLIAAVEDFKSQTSETMALMRQAIENGVQEMKKEGLGVVEEALKVAGKGIGSISAELADLREELTQSNGQSKVTKSHKGSALAMIFSIVAMASAIASLYMVFTQ